MIQLREIRAVVVFSDNPRQLADWYKGQLVARELVTTEGFIGLHVGAVMLFVQRTSEGHRPGVGGIRPHFTVDDCRAAFDALVEAGGRPLLQPTDTGGEYVAALQDPDGNPIGLLQPKGR